MFLEMEDPGKPIEMMINSPGGKVAAGLAIYDWMQLVSSPVHTMCWGRCSSHMNFLHLPIVSGFPLHIFTAVPFWTSQCRGNGGSLLTGDVLCRAYSMGAVLLAAGEKGHRVILPNAKVCSTDRFFPPRFAFALSYRTGFRIVLALLCSILPHWSK